MTSLHWAVKNSDSRVLANNRSSRLAIVNEKTIYGSSLLHLAVNNSNPEILITMLRDLSESERIIAIQQKDNIGKTPVQLAVIASKHNALFIILERLSALDVRLILQDRCYGNTLLHQAIAYNSPATVGAILRLSQEDRIVASSFTNNLNAGQKSFKPGKVSQIGIFSQAKIDESNEDFLTPLQTSLLESFVGF